MARTNVNPASRQNYLIPESLTHSSGIITATIFGQAYTVSVGSPTANALSFLYLNAGSLVTTTTVPSTYRVSNPNAILVGAWYANAATSAGWGAFVNIEGAPETLTEISEAGTTQLNAFYAGMTSFTVTAYNWSRVGRHLFVTVRLDSVSPNAVSFRVPLPRGILGVENNYHIGHYSGQNGAVNALGGSMIGAGSSDVAAGNSITSGSTISLATGNTIMGTGPTTWGCTFRTHIGTWNSTPLKDL